MTDALPYCGHRFDSPALSAMDRALEEMRMGKVRARRRYIRDVVQCYDRRMLRAHLDLPEEYYWMNNEFITRKVIKRIKSRIRRHRQLSGYLKRAVPTDAETLLWGFLGGEMAALKRIREREQRT